MPRRRSAIQESEAGSAPREHLRAPAARRRACWAWDSRWQRSIRFGAPSSWPTRRPPTEELPHLRFALARALWDSGRDRPGARALAARVAGGHSSKGKADEGDDALRRTSGGVAVGASGVGRVPANSPPVRRVRVDLDVLVLPPPVVVAVRDAAGSISPRCVTCTCTSTIRGIGHGYDGRPRPRPARGARLWVAPERQTAVDPEGATADCEEGLEASVTDARR